MKVLLEKSVQFLTSEDGPTTTEYAFMLALIVILTFVAVTAIGGKVSTTFSGLESGLPDGE